LDLEIKNCFKGVRIEKNGVTVNQFRSCSFDPSTLLCITCGREHKVLEGEGGPDCFAVTDQNFIGTLPGTDQKNCLHILRIENSSLIELANIFIEVMEGKTLRPGTCILVGSLSHLSRVGVEAYTAEWRLCVHMLASKWSGISICPLFPIHASALLGNLFGDLPFCIPGLNPSTPVQPRDSLPAGTSTPRPYLSSLRVLVAWIRLKSKPRSYLSTLTSTAGHRLSASPPAARVRP
jgi:hypothetical protein